MKAVINKSFKDMVQNNNSFFTSFLNYEVWLTRSDTYDIMKFGATVTDIQAHHE